MNVIIVIFYNFLQHLRSFKLNNQSKEDVSQLIKNFSPKLKSIELMDEFEEGGYLQLIIRDYPFDRWNSTYRYHLVIERNNKRFPNYVKLVGDGVTFSQLKTKKAEELNEEFDIQITDNKKIEYLDSEKILYFWSPIKLRAQNSGNRTGYGTIYDWSYSKNQPSFQGTLYGETTDYKIVGLYIAGYNWN